MTCVQTAHPHSVSSLYNMLASQRWFSSMGPPAKPDHVNGETPENARLAGRQHTHAE